VSDETPARSLALLGGAVFVLVGVLGFVPGVTTHYGALRFAGHGSHAELFGVFRVSILLNVVHLLVGAIGIVTARTTTSVIASLALWLLGVLSAGALLSLDAADNWLHFVLAVVLLGLGSVVGRAAACAAPA
jgi:hypothetical protein